MGRLAGADGADAHVSSRLDDYLLGTLSTAEEFVVEAHILRCPTCRSECHQLSDVAAQVATLPPAMVASIEDMTRVGRPRAGRPALAFAAVLVLGAILGAGGWILAGPVSIHGVPAGSDTQDGTAGRLSVTVADRAGGGLDVRAVAVGLRPGLAFELIAVAEDGRNYVVARGMAVGGPQTILGSLPVAASGVRFLAIVQADGEILLVARPP